MSRRRLTWIVAPLVAGLALWLSFRGVDLVALMQQLRHANPWLLLLYVALSPLHLLLRTWRWQTMLAPIRPDLPRGELFSAIAIGYVAMLLPGRVGEVVRPALAHRRLALPFAPVLATVGVERVVLDMLAVLIAGAIALLLPVTWSGLDEAADPAWLERLRIVGAAALVIGLGALLFVQWLGRRRDWVARYLDDLADRLPGRIMPIIARWPAGLLLGFASLAAPAGMLKITVQSVLIWLVIAGGMQAGVVASGVDMPPAGILVLLPILALGIAMPVPGGMGTFHLAMKLGLIALFNVDETMALSAGLIVHAFNWLPYLIMGIVCMLRGGLEKTTRAGALASEGTLGQ